METFWREILYYDACKKGSIESGIVMQAAEDIWCLVLLDYILNLINHKMQR